MRLVFLSGLTIVTAILFSSCGNNKADQPETELDTVAVYSWAASLNDSTGRLELKKQEGMGPDSLSIPATLAYLNTAYPNIKLDLVKISNDTVYLKIDEANYLTQQMGSSGPTLYLSEVVYDLTEIPGIRNVSFAMEEGDHAGPGVYSRESFKDE
mgnify:CR=1 FL=1